MDWKRPPGATRLVLLRHGETEEAARGRCVGRLEVGLSAHGADQARRCAERLLPAGIAALYASPSRRATGTARPIAEACGVELRLLDDLREVDFGALEGLTFEEVAALHPAVHHAWMSAPDTVRFPGGEDPGQLRDRALRVLAAVRERHPGEAIAVVSHGGPIRALLVHALGMAPGNMFRLDVSFGGMSVIDWFDDGAVVRLHNWA